MRIKWTFSTLRQTPLASHNSYLKYAISPTGKGLLDLTETMHTGRRGLMASALDSSGAGLSPVWVLLRCTFGKTRFSQSTSPIG